MKSLYIILHILLLINCKGQEDKKADRLSNEKHNTISNKWFGTYKTRFSYGEIGGTNAGWDLEITVNEKNITATGNGYQIGFKDELLANENGNELTFKFKKNIEGYSLGESMNPEFILKEFNGKYYLESEWIDSDIITKPEKNGFVVKKE